MSMNKYMHPRNIYRTRTDFVALSLEYPEFRKYVKINGAGNASFNFKNQDALRLLTKLLLKIDFGLDVIIPETALVPTVPSRLNYILWLEDLLNWNPESPSEITGIDIGTGATCIYPLLAAKKNKWKMIGTEFEEASVETATENVSNNSLTDLITVKKVSRTTYLWNVGDNNVQYDFCMCNPPFFINKEGVGSMAKSRRRRKRPKNGLTGTDGELKCEGGEVEFIKHIIEDSAKLKNRIRIYTTMVGQKSSVAPVLNLLKARNVSSIGRTEFCQGNTTRWGIAWSFEVADLPDFFRITRKQKPLQHAIPLEFNYAKCYEIILHSLVMLEIDFSLPCRNQNSVSWTISAQRNTWVRKKRKMRNDAWLTVCEEKGLWHPEGFISSGLFKTYDAKKEKIKNYKKYGIKPEDRSVCKSEEINNKKDNGESTDMENRVRNAKENNHGRKPFIGPLQNENINYHGQQHIQITYVGPSNENNDELDRKVKNVSRDNTKYERKLQNENNVSSSIRPPDVRIGDCASGTEDSDTYIKCQYIDIVPERGFVFDKPKLKTTKRTSVRDNDAKSATMNANGCDQSNPVACSKQIQKEGNDNGSSSIPVDASTQQQDKRKKYGNRKRKYDETEVPYDFKNEALFQQSDETKKNREEKKFTKEIQTILLKLKQEDLLESRSPVFEANLALIECKSGRFLLEMTFDRTDDKSPEQFFQFLRNRFQMPSPKQVV